MRRRKILDMTRIRTIRDIVIPIPNGTHTIQRETYFYTYGSEADVIANGAAIRVPEAWVNGKEDVWLFVDEDIEIVEDPIPF